MNDFFISKAFIEVRYPENLLFNDMSILQNISDTLMDIIPQRNYDKNNNSLNFASNDGKYRVNLWSNRLILDCDDPSTFEEFKNRSNYILKVIIQKLMINYIIRIGMRTFRGIEKKSIEEANEYISSKYLSKSKEYSKNIGDIMNCGVNFSFTGNKYNVNLALKPNMYQAITITQGKAEQIYRSEVQVDTDVFISNIKEINNIYEIFIDDVIHINNIDVKDFIEKMSE